ncbi:MAG: hypothetical protein ACODAA_08055 [Gemmatimonadota bacterium]
MSTTHADTIKTKLERNVRAVTLRPSVGQGTAVTTARLGGDLTCEVRDGAFTPKPGCRRNDRLRDVGGAARRPDRRAHRDRRGGRFDLQLRHGDVDGHAEDGGYRDELHVEIVPPQVDLQDRLRRLSTR